jgi:hypothetical protein
MTRAEAIAHLEKASRGGQQSASQTLDVFRALGVLGYPAGQGVGDAPIRGERAWRLALKELPVRDRSKAIYRVYRRVTGASSPWSRFPREHRVDVDAIRIADEERCRRLRRAQQGSLQQNRSEADRSAEAERRAAELYSQDETVRDWLEAASQRTGLSVYADARPAEPLPRQTWLVNRALERSRRAGLVLPDFGLYWVTGAGGWAKRVEDGQTISYSMTLGVDVSTVDLVTTAHHEARHLADMLSGDWRRFTSAEREWLAISWSRDMLQRTPAEEL